MSIQAILAPLFVHVALTFFLLFWTGRTRFAAIRAKEVRVGDIALGQRAWPAKPTQIANAYGNQFELPVLFYAVVALALVTRQADFLFVVLAWVFVVSRLVHAGIYTTTNTIMHRFQAFVFGVLVLMAMWILFAVKILLAL
ncbi:MAG TPA: MAPEG family protein [Microvirga sp.]|jgi:hypothetical protein